MSRVKAVTAEVSGLVQGVGFRYATQAQASRLGLVGWVQNQPDGGVAVFAQGSPEAVDQLTAWLRSGPRVARVTRLQVEAAEPDEALRSFHVRY